MNCLKLLLLNLTFNKHFLMFIIANLGSELIYISVINRLRPKNDKAKYTLTCIVYLLKIKKKLFHIYN